MEDAKKVYGEHTDWVQDERGGSGTGDRIG